MHLSAVIFCIVSGRKEKRDRQPDQDTTANKHNENIGANCSLPGFYILPARRPVGFESIRRRYQGEHALNGCRLIFYRHVVFCRSDALAGGGQMGHKTRWQISIIPDPALQQPAWLDRIERQLICANSPCSITVTSLAVCCFASSSRC